MLVRLIAPSRANRRRLLICLAAIGLVVLYFISDWELLSRRSAVAYAPCAPCDAPCASCEPSSPPPSPNAAADGLQDEPEEQPPIATPPLHARVPADPLLSPNVRLESLVTSFAASRAAGVSTSELSAGTPVLGSAARWNALFARLDAGHPLRMQTLGSSVTAEGGSTELRGRDLKLYERAVTTERRDRPGYFREFIKWVNETWPHTRHAVVNSGMGARSLGVQLECTEQLLVPDADIYVVEAGAILASHAAVSMEAFVRKIVIDRPHAVVLFWGVSPWCEQSHGFPDSCNFSTAHPETVQPFSYENLRRFYVRDAGKGTGSIEDALTLAQYYDMPMIVLRDAYFHAIAQRRVGFGYLDLFNGPDNGLHLRGTRAIALERDLFCWLFVQVYHRRTIRALALRGAEDAPIERSIVIPDEPLMLAVNENPLLWSRCVNWAVEIENDKATRITLGAKPDIVENVGWAVVDEAKKGVHDNIRSRFGFAAHSPNATFVIRIEFRTPSWVNTTLARLGTGQPSYAVSFQYVTSYEHMGRARLECARECECDPVEFDAHVTERVSLEAPVQLLLKRPSEVCLIRCTVLDGTSSGEHKVTLRRVAAKVTTFPVEPKLQIFS